VEPVVSGSTMNDPNPNHPGRILERNVTEWMLNNNNINNNHSTAESQSLFWVFVNLETNQKHKKKRPS
jgi:hypothetical protein